MHHPNINVSFEQEEGLEPSRGGGGSAAEAREIEGVKKRTRKGVLSFGGACGSCRASKAKCDGKTVCSRCLKFQKCCEYTNPQRRPNNKSKTNATQPPPPPAAITFIVPSHPLLTSPLPKVASVVRPRVVKKERSPSAPLTPPSSEHSYDHQPRLQWGYVSLHPYPHRLPSHPPRSSPPSPTSTASRLVHAPPPASVPSHHPRQTPSPPLSRHSPTQIDHRHHPYHSSLTLPPILNSNERRWKGNSSTGAMFSTRLPSPSLLFPELGLSYRLSPPNYDPRRVRARWDGRGGEFGAEGGLLKALGF